MSLSFMLLFYCYFRNYGVAAALADSVGHCDIESLLRQSLFYEVIAYLSIEARKSRAVGSGWHLTLEGEGQQAVALGYSC